MFVHDTHLDSDMRKAIDLVCSERVSTDTPDFVDFFFSLDDGCRDSTSNVARA